MSYPYRKSRIETGTYKNNFYALLSMQRHKEQNIGSKTINNRYNKFTKYRFPTDQEILSKYKIRVDKNNPRYIRPDELRPNMYSSGIVRPNINSTARSGTRLTRDPYYVYGKIGELMGGRRNKEYNYRQFTIN